MNDHSYLHITLIYLAAINMVTFFMYGIDKWKSSSLHPVTVVSTRRANARQFTIYKIYILRKTALPFGKAVDVSYPNLGLPACL